jgi:phenylpyruvate tautomerase PptA (4-oxalocrotonate tautomerase family)
VPLVTIDLLRGRSHQQLGAISDAVHEAMVELLAERADLPEEDLAVMMIENGREDWSFGRGQASYLEIPREEWR